MYVVKHSYVLLSYWHWIIIGSWVIVSTSCQSFEIMKLVFGPPRQKSTLHGIAWFRSSCLFNFTNFKLTTNMYRHTCTHTHTYANTQTRELWCWPIAWLHIYAIVIAIMSSFILGSQLYENAFLNWFNTNLQFSFYSKIWWSFIKIPGNCFKPKDWLVNLNSAVHLL